MPFKPKQHMFSVLAVSHQMIFRFPLKTIQIPKPFCCSKRNTDRFACGSPHSMASRSKLQRKAPVCNPECRLRTSLQTEQYSYTIYLRCRWLIKHEFVFHISPVINGSLLGLLLGCLVILPGFTGCLRSLFRVDRPAAPR